MRNAKVITWSAVSISLLLAALAWGQGGNPPASTKESGKTSGHGMTAAEQTGRPAGTTAEKLVGTWRLVSETAHQGDKTTQPLGPNPLGMMMFDRGGRFMLLISRPGLPKFAAASGTPERQRRTRRCSPACCRSTGLTRLTMPIRSSSYVLRPALSPTG